MTEVVTVLAPRGENGPAWTARDSPADAGRRLAVERPDAIDHVLIGAGAFPGPPTAKSDFEWSWTRVSRDGNRLLEWVGIRGQSFDFGGAFRFRADLPVEWVTVTRSGGDLHVDLGPPVAAEVALDEEVSRLVVNGKPADTQGDEASRVKIRRLKPELRDHDVRH